MKTIAVSPVNFALVIVGGILMTIGLFQTNPIKLNKAFFWQYTPLVGMTLCGSYFLLRSRTGMFETWARPVAIEWASKAFEFAARFFPLMVMLVILMSLGTIMIKVYNRV